MNLQDSLELVTTLLDSLPSMFAKSQVVDNCFMAALYAANVMVNPIGVRLILFQVAQTIIKHPLLAPRPGIRRIALPW